MISPWNKSVYNHIMNEEGDYYTESPPVLCILHWTYCYLINNIWNEYVYHIIFVELKP